MKRPLAAAAFAIGVALTPAAARAQDAPPAQSQATAHSLYEDGRKALAAGDHNAAVTALYGSLEKLRAEGRGGSADAGLVAGFLGAALEKLDHPQTEQAWRLAFTLLERAANPARFIEAASGLLRRMNTPQRADEADQVIERLMQRIDVEGAADDARIEALNIAVGYYRRSDRKADGDALTLTHAIRLNGETETALEIRGLTRLRRATAAFGDGKLREFDAEIEAAISDLGRTGAAAARELGTALALKAKMRMKEGAYAAALPPAEEAAAVLEATKAEDRYQEARIIQIRVLERVGRGREALNLSRELKARYEKTERPDANHAALLRLLIVEMLAANRRIAEARELLEHERQRVATLEDKLALGQYYDRLAELDLLESDFAGAARAAESALTTFRQARPDEKALWLEAMRKRASATEGMRDRAYGDRAHRELIDLSSTLFHSAHPEFARDLDAYAGFLEAEGRTQEAFDMRMRSLAALERAYGEDGVKVAFALNNLASLLGANSHSEEAVRALERAIAIVGDGPELAARRMMMRANLASSLIALDRADDAMREIERARADASHAEQERERLLAIADIVEMMALDALERTPEAYRKGERVVAGAQRVAERGDASNLLAVHLKMAQMAQKMGDDYKALRSAGLAMNLLTAERIETDGKWRATAETTLPSLWRLGQK